MANLALTTRDVARELARRYSTMTHDELDVLESILREHLLGSEGTCTPVLFQERQRTDRAHGCRKQHSDVHRKSFHGEAYKTTDYGAGAFGALCNAKKTVRASGYEEREHSNPLPQDIRRIAHR